MRWRDRIVVEPQVCHGAACIKDTRVMAYVVMDNLAAGQSRKAILVSYPRLTEADIDAAIAYAAAQSRQRFIAFARGED